MEIKNIQVNDRFDRYQVNDKVIVTGTYAELRHIIENYEKCSNLSLIRQHAGDLDDVGVVVSFLREGKSIDFQKKEPISGPIQTILELENLLNGVHSEKESIRVDEYLIHKNANLHENGSLRYDECEFPDGSKISAVPDFLNPDSFTIDNQRGIRIIAPKYFIKGKFSAGYKIFQELCREYIHREEKHKLSWLSIQYPCKVNSFVEMGIKKDRDNKGDPNYRLIFPAESLSNGLGAVRKAKDDGTERQKFGLPCPMEGFFWQDYCAGNPSVESGWRVGGEVDYIHWESANKKPAFREPDYKRMAIMYPESWEDIEPVFLDKTAEKENDPAHLISEYDTNLEVTGFRKFIARIWK